MRYHDDFHPGRIVSAGNDEYKINTNLFNILMEVLEVHDTINPFLTQ